MNLESQNQFQYLNAYIIFLHDFVLKLFKQNLFFTI